MHVLGIIGSMRKHGHTNTLVNRVISDMKHIDDDVGTEIVYMADKTVCACKVVCSEYCSRNAYQCSISDDATGILSLMMKADALIVGAPLYFRAPPAKFHTFIERLISMFFFRETCGDGDNASPLAGKPCGLIGVAEYSNPHRILEYLHDFCSVLKMRPAVLDAFPYLGVAGQGNIVEDNIFHPFERSKDLAGAVIEEVRKRDGRSD